MTKGEFNVSISNEIKACVDSFVSRPRLISNFCNDSQSIVAEYNRRQIFEMLQNVDDQMDESSLLRDDKCCLIEFDKSKRSLCFKNQGVPFSDEGIKSIMLPHTSPKKKLGKTTIGNKGLGFRSLLNWKPDEIIIRSNRTELTFSKEVVKEKIDGNPALKKAVLSQRNDGSLPMLVFPKIGNDESGSKWVTEIELRWKDHGVGLETLFADIENELRSFKSELMLFLPRLLKVGIIIVSSEGKDSFEFESAESDYRAVGVSDQHLYKKSITQSTNGEPSSKVDWLVYRDSCELDGVKLAGDDSRNFNLAIAIPFDPLVRSQLDGVLYNYLPIKSAEQAVEINLPCLVHATVKLKASRDALMPDDEANKHIFSRLLPAALGSFAGILKNHNELLHDKWFPYRLLSPTSETRNSCVRSLYSELRTILMGGTFCPCVDGDYRKIGECWHYSFLPGARTQITQYFNEHKFLPEYVLSDATSEVPKNFEDSFCSQAKLADAINTSIKDMGLTDEQLAKLIAVLIQISDRTTRGAPYASILRDETGYFNVEDDVYTSPSEEDARSIAKPQDMVIGFISSRLWECIKLECGYENNCDKWKRPRDFVNDELRKVVNLHYYDLADITRNIINWCNDEVRKQSATPESKQHAVTEMLKAMLENFDPTAKVEGDDYRRRMDIPLVVRSSDGKVFLSRDFLFDSAKEIYAGSDISDSIFMSEADRRALFGEVAQGRDVDAFLLSIGMRADVRIKLHELKRDDGYISFLRDLEKGHGKEQLNGGLPDGSANPLPPRQYVQAIFEEDLKCIRKLGVEQFLRLLTSQQKDGILRSVENNPVMYWTIANKQAPWPLKVEWTYLAWQVKDVLTNFILENSRLVEDFKRRLDDKIQPVGLAVDALVKLGARRRLVDLSLEELYSRLAGFDIQQNRGVQKYYQRIRMALRQRIQECEKKEERLALEKRCSELAKKNLTHLYARKGDGPIELVARDDIRYWDNDLLSRKILNDNYKLEIGSRVGAESVRILFGVKPLGNDVDEQKDSKEPLHAITSELNRRIRERRAFLLAVRYREIENDNLLSSAVSALKGIQVEVVRKCSYKFDGKLYEMLPGELIQVSRDEHRFIVCTDALTLKEALSDPKFCLVMGELFCILFSLTGTQIAGEFRNIITTSLDALELYYKNDGDENDFKAVKEALGLSEDEEQLWSSVAGRQLTDKEKMSLSEKNERRSCILTLTNKQDNDKLDLSRQMAELSDEQVRDLILWVGMTYKKCSRMIQERILNCYRAEAKEIRELYTGNFAQALHAKLRLKDEHSQECYCGTLWAYSELGMGWFDGCLLSLMKGDHLPDQGAIEAAFFEKVKTEFEVELERVGAGGMFSEAPKADSECLKLLANAGLSLDNLPPTVQSKLFFRKEGLEKIVKAEIEKIIGDKNDPTAVASQNQQVVFDGHVKDIVQISDLKGVSQISPTKGKHEGDATSGRKRAVAYRTDRQKHMAGLRAQKKAWAAMLKDPQRFRQPVDKTSLTGDQGIGNDACHYDFSYLDTDGRRRFVEVKAFDEGVFYMSNAEYDFAHAEENRERYDLMLVVGDDVQYIKAPFSKNSEIGKHLKIVEDSWKGFAV